MSSLCRFLVFSLSVLLAGCNRQITFASATSSEGTSFETHYAPSENLEALDARLLRSAHSSIDLCAYAFTDHALADALIDSASRGVKVRVYLDRGQASAELNREEAKEERNRSDGERDNFTPSDANVLERLASTPNIEVRIKHSRTLMHLKTYLVDSVVLRSGSANFSPTGEKRQDNDLLLTRDKKSIEQFKLNFETLWTRPDNEMMLEPR